MAGCEVPYGYTRELPGVGFDEAVLRTTEALKAEGFGVLTTIDVKETLKKKLSVDFRRYMILGACNPQLAHQALTAEFGVGLLLPCNVNVFEGDKGQVVVQVGSPRSMFEVAQREDLEPVVAEADQRLRRALERV